MKKVKAMITLAEFKRSSFDEKCDAITIYSDYLMMRSKEDCNIYLYHLDAFFIEVSFSTRIKKVVSINGFDNPMELIPYAERISLEDLNLPSVI